MGGYAPGSAHLIINSQCVLDCEHTMVSGTGHELTIRWRLKPLGTFTGIKKTYAYVIDLMGKEDGWNQVGSWTIWDTSMLLTEEKSQGIGTQFDPNEGLDQPPEATD